MKKFIMLIIILLVLVPGSYLYACTGFCISKGDTVLVGNNEDYNNPNTKVWYVPAEKGKYGRVYFGFDNFFPQGGINEKGLVFDSFASEPYKVKYSLDKPIFSGSLMDKVVSECATVDEALEMFDKYSMAFLTQGMLFIADEHGNSAIIERDNVIRKKGKYQVCTNFYQSKTKKEDINCGRYKIATAMLENADDISVDLGKRVLAATHNEGAYPTLYSNVYDLKRRIVYLYHFHNFQNEVVIDLKAELAKGARTIDLPELFPKTFVAENFKNSSRAASKKQKAPNHQWKLVPRGNDYSLINKGSGQAMGVTGASTQRGALLVQWPYDENAPNHQWKLIPRGNGYYSLINKNSGQAMGVAGASTQRGALLVQWPYDENAPNHQWQIVPPIKE